MKNFTSLIKETFEIFKQKNAIWSILIVFLIGILISIIIYSSLFFGLIAALAGAKTTLLLVSLLLMLIILLLTGIWSLFVMLALMIYIIKPEKNKLKEIFKEAWNKLGQGLWIAILTIFFAGLVSIFFIIPGIIVGLLLSLGTYILIVEDKKGMAALKRSWNLVKGGWWKFVGRILLLAVIINIFFYILNSIHEILVSIFQFIFIPFNIIFIYLLYLELKKIAESRIPASEVQPKPMKIKENKEGN
jgi:hypothetical protein